MKVSRGLPALPLPPNPVLTIGNFDGQHVGHRQLLASVVQCAREQRGTPMVLTFDPHPVLVLSPGTSFQFLTSPSEKLAWFETQGVEHLVMLPFTTTFASLSPQEFVFSILRDGLGVRDLFVGEHFVFGKNRAGNTDTLRDVGRTSRVPGSSPQAREFIGNDREFDPNSPVHPGREDWNRPCNVWDGRIP